MNITFYSDASQLTELMALPLNEQNDYVRRFFIAYLTSPSEQLIDNVHVQVELIEVDGTLIPITICSNNWRDAYVVSLYAHYIEYAIEELVILPNRALRFILAGLIRMIGLVFRALRTDRTVFVNNWMFSTNLYANLTEAQLKAVIDCLEARHPQHFIVFRSLHSTFYKRQIESLARYGAKPLISRQVYLSKREDHRSATDRKHIYSDRSLLRRKGYRVVREFEMTEDLLERIKFLYDSLYISKYSKYNPQFTVHFYKAMMINRGLEFILVFDQDVMIGVIGYWKLNGVMTVPVLGYDVEHGKETGAYRVLSYLLAEEAVQHDLELNQSSGAAQFKLNRGTVATIEFSYIYSKHLFAARRFTMETMATALTWLCSLLIGKFRI